MSSEKSWQLRVTHILEAIGKIQRYTAGLTLDSFSADEKTVDAVIRNFQVLGEAARHIPELIQTKYSDVPWSIMQGMRHILIHDYFRVKVDIVWRTIEVDLPPLLPRLQQILNDNP